MQRIDFIIAGVQKGGTTALDAMFRGHPSVQMAAGRKELHFFDDDGADWRSPDYGPLHAHFDWSVPAVRGEATPIYTYWPRSLERIARYNPDIRVIVCLRHPAMRAHSHWRMEVSRGAETLPFREAIRGGRARVGHCHRVFSYVERGYYAPQVTEALRLFGAERTLFLRTDCLWSAPRESFDRACDLLSVPAMPVNRRYVVPIDTRDMRPMDADDFLYLRDLHASDIAETQRLTGLDLRDWLDPDYAEPMPTVLREPAGISDNPVIAPPAERGDEERAFRTGRRP